MFSRLYSMSLNCTIFHTIGSILQSQIVHMKQMTRKTQSGPKWLHMLRVLEEQRMEKVSFNGMVKPPMEENIHCMENKIGRKLDLSTLKELAEDLKHMDADPWNTHAIETRCTNTLALI